MPRPARTIPATLVLLCALALAGHAQEWRGDGRAHGTVLDADGEPLPGARVELRLHDRDDGPPPALAGPDGSWTTPRLAPGLYDVRIEAPGHLPAEGWIQVPADRPSEPVRVEMQSLDLVTPSFAESDPVGTVSRWLEVGDALLAQERPAAARAEYEKALGTPAVLTPAARAELLSTIARTHFLEGDAAAAERALRAAVVVAPDGSPEASRMRELFSVLLENEGRGDEARRFFDRLRRDRAAVEAEVADLLTPRRRNASSVGGDSRSAAPPGPPERPVLPAEPGRTGRFRFAFPNDAAASPLSAPETYLARYGVDRATAERADPDGLDYALAEETFEAYVPEAYEPGAGYGLLVWVSPTPFGGVETAEVRSALDRARLLWVGANRSGNTRPNWDRAGLALDAAQGVAALYDLDPERIYVAGYSGGGRMASGLALLYPEVFRGALSVYGVSWFEPVPVPDRPGAHWPAAFAAPPRESLRKVAAESRFVLVTGSREFNKPQTRAIHRAMAAAGFEHATYLEVPGASHYELPDGEWFARALAALDRR